MKARERSGQGAALVPDGWRVTVSVKSYLYGWLGKMDTPAVRMKATRRH